MLSASFAVADNSQQRIQKKIEAVSSSLHSAQTKSRKLSEQVVSLEKNLSDIAKSQYHTKKKMEKLSKKLGKTNYEKQQLLKSIRQQKEALAQQMQALYTSGEQSHLRLLLKQDDPSDIGRTVKYFEYLNRSRLKKITLIRVSLEKIKGIEEGIVKDHAKLANLKIQLATQKISLNDTLKKREKSLKRAKTEVASNTNQLKQLKRQEVHLKRVITNLITKQDKEEKTQRKKVIPSAQVAKKITTRKKVTQQTRFISSRPFSSLRGRLSWPVRGRMMHRYGSRRNAKQRWKGVVIEASGGQKVRAVARGTIEFAGRLNGYGYLVIIRHDKNYRSLYGYNRAIYKKTGQTINAGEVIAAVGNSGGQTKNALYFEIRKGTRLQNPSNWCH
jgi:septal ring factor EnvC (AmiA/AmiB activator)